MYAVKHGIWPAESSAKKPQLHVSLSKSEEGAAHGPHAHGPASGQPELPQNVRYGPLTWEDVVLPFLRRRAQVRDAHAGNDGQLGCARLLHGRHSPHVSSGVDEFPEFKGVRQVQDSWGPGANTWQSLDVLSGTSPDKTLVEWALQ